MDDEVLDPAVMLERSARLEAATRAEAAPHAVGWFAAMAALMPVAFTGIGAARGEPGILAVALVFAGVVLALSGLLLGVRAFPTGFTRRFVPAMLVWGAVFGVLLSVGLLFFRAELAYWIPAGIVTALPLALAARREARAR
ncbi:hypothetical protein [Naasia sp. SYSU D00057]|uniref:hypothetical protein n=1 Tax=Naasia sp. SYSU D00057 TaxID=2817380 RepID=UPI001B30F54E|nr:hypothetical protein [Naasia sp. SYSU D00057]